MVNEAFPEKVTFEQTSDDESVQQDQSIPGRGEGAKTRMHGISGEFEAH